MAPFLKFLPVGICICSSIAHPTKEITNLPLYQQVNFHCSHKTLTIVIPKELITLASHSSAGSTVPLLILLSPWLPKPFLSPHSVGTFLFTLFWWFHSICHCWTFIAIGNILFPQHPRFLVCLFIYYHYLSDILLPCLPLSCCFGLGPPLFSLSALSTGNAHLLSPLTSPNYH